MILNDIFPKKTNILFFAILVLAFVIRFFHLSYQSLHLDEAFILTLVKNFDFYQIIENAIKRDPRPPLYYLTLYYWIKVFGSTEAGGRMLTAFFGWVVIIPVFMIAKRLFNKKTALMSIFLLAINPFNIYYSQLIKEVTLVVFFTVTALLFFIEALENNKKKYWILFVLCSLISIYTHYAACFSIVSYFIYLLIARKRYSSVVFRNCILSFFGIFICYLPGFWFMLHNLFIMSDYYKIVPGVLEEPSFTQLVKWLFYSFSWFIKGEIQCWSFFLNNNRKDLLNILPLFILCFIFLRPKYLRKVLKENLYSYLLLAIIILFPMFFELASVRLRIIYYNPRHIAYVSCFFMILVSHAVINSKRSIMIFFMIIIILLMSIPYILLNIYQQEDWRSAIKWLNGKYSQGDVVGLLDPITDTVFFEYYNNSKLNYFGIPYDCYFSIPIENYFARVDKDNMEFVKSRILNNCSSKKMLWVISRGADEAGSLAQLDPNALIMSYLDSSYSMVDKKNLRASMQILR